MEHEHRWSANFWEPGGPLPQADYRSMIPVKCVSCGKTTVAVVLP